MINTNNDMGTILQESVFCNAQKQIEMVFPEEIELGALIEMLASADKILLDLKKNNIAPKLLADVSLLKKIPTPSRQKGSEWIVTNNNVKIAVYGKNSFMKYFVNFLIIATRKSGTMKFFKTRKAAVDWLNV